jgi:hypothetical protein
MTPIFHRFGYYETFKLNRSQFIDLKYEANQWYQLDFLLDWETKQVAFFIDGKFRTIVGFYSAIRDEFLAQKDKNCAKREFVNTLSIYTLTPGVTSSFR